MPENLIAERAMRWQLSAIAEQPSRPKTFSRRHLNRNDISLLVSGVFQTSVAVKLTVGHNIQMGLLLDPDEFLANKDLHKVRLSEIERKIFPKPILTISMFTMTPEQQHALVDQILAANPSDAEIEAHLEQAFIKADASARILLSSMQNAGRKRQALEELNAYLPVHKQLSHHSFKALKVLKKQLLHLHTTGNAPKPYNFTTTPNLLQFLTHLYRFKSSVHPITFSELEAIYLQHHNIHVDHSEVDPAFLSNQLPLSPDSLPFVDPLADVLSAA